MRHDRWKSPSHVEMRMDKGEEKKHTTCCPDLDRSLES